MNLNHDARLEVVKELIGRNDLAAARAAVTAILNDRATDAGARFEFARILQIGGDDAGAETEYQRVIREDPGMVDAHLELARIYRRLGQRDRAFDMYHRISGLTGGRMDVFQELARLSEEAGLLDQAVSSLCSASSLAPDNTAVRIELGCLQREAGREADAAKTFQALLASPSVARDPFIHNTVLNELEITQRKTILSSKPRAMIAMILDRCNIQCRICHIWEGKWQVRPSVMQEIVELFPYMEDICWEGGEVFLMKGFDDILAEGGKHPHLKQVIFTNGLLITEPILRKIDAGRADIVFSIDAVDKETYEYIRRGARHERLLSVLSLVREFKRSTGTRFNTYLNPVIMRSNHTQLEAFVEFAREYAFTAVTFTPVRGNFNDENIFELRDEKALTQLRQSLPAAQRLAREYGIRLNNWLPLSDCPGDAAAASSPCGDPAPGAFAAPATSRMICYAPWQRLTIDSGGPARPFAFCLNKFAGNTNDMSLAEIWNGEVMQWYRAKIARNDVRDICQPECISGQVRDKICKLS